MEERSGSLGNGGFDTGFFYLAGWGTFLITFWVSNFMVLASQSVFICEDDHMVYDFKET